MLFFKPNPTKFYGSAILGLLLIGVFAAAFNITTVGGQGGNWWDPNWQYRKMITINHTKVNADQTNFPILINITDSDLVSKAQPDGDDIVFTDSFAIKLDHEIESYNVSAGQLVAWVRVPSLSSTSDTVLYMYYGNAGASNQQNVTGVWDSNYVMVHHLEETDPPPQPYWHKYEGNPILNGSKNGFGSVFYDNSTGVYHLFCSWDSVLHFTSSDGKNWTADSNNPILTGAGVPMVWKENSTWYMLYRYGSPIVIGLANSTDAVHWTKYEGNPVLTGDSGKWDDPSYSLDPWGVIKIGSTYYLWYNTIGSVPGLGRCTGLATSTNLTKWTKDPNNPIFTGGRFCGFSFKYDGYYYMLMPHYTAVAGYGEIELFRDINPTFYLSSREYLGVPITFGPPGAWDDHRFDTPCVLTDTVQRDTYAASSNELWTYYAATGTPTGNGSDWWTGMCIEQNISEALSRQPISFPPINLDSTSNYNNGKVYGNLNRNAAGQIDGADIFDGGDDYIDCGNNTSLRGMNNLTIEAWVKPNKVGGGGIVSKWSSWTPGTGGSYLLWQGSTGNVGWGVNTETSTANFYDTPALQAGQWYHLVGIYNGSQIRLYMNGTQVGTPKSVTGKIASNNDLCYIGRYSTVYMNGTIDEVRISNVSRSLSWITTEYNNQRSPSTFYNVGNEESQLAKIYIVPSLVEKTPSDIGTIFKLNVTIQDVKDMWGFDFNLTWDNSLIALASVDFNTTLDAIWGHDNWFLASNQTGLGYYKLVAVSLSTGFNSTGPTSLVTLTFRVEDPLSNLARETSIHFTTHKLSNSYWQPIPHSIQDGTYRITGKKPSLKMTPTSVVCRKFCENFTIMINVSDAYNVEDLEFEVHYNTTLINYVNVTWNAWGIGTINIDEVGGNITGSTSGSPINGNLTLVTITFHAAYHHIWKDLPGWTNNLTGTIFFQWANLSYPSAPDLGYEKGGLNQINVGPDVTYTFAPIQGDVDNNGYVDIFDLRTVAAFYDTVNPEYNLTGDPVIDIYDLVVIGANFGYTYDP